MFNTPHSTDVAAMLRADLDVARAKWIDAAASDMERKRREQSSFLKDRDESGRVVDFHALKHTFGTNLARAGVHPKIAQDLMRRSDINLTMTIYTHTVLADRSVALRGLPDVTAEDARVAKAG